MTMSGDLFQRISLFEGLTFEQRQLLRPLFIPCDYPASTVLFEQGEPADFLFLVATGEVVIRYKPEDGPAMVISRVRPGGVVGWSAALGNRRYTSSAVCNAYCQMLRVRGEVLRQLCEEQPEIGAVILNRLADIIAERLRYTHDQVITLLKQGMQVSAGHV